MGNGKALVRGIFLVMALLIPMMIVQAQGEPSGRFVDNGDGTIADKQTGLMWEKKTGDGTVHDVDNRYTWSASGTAPDGRLFTDFLATLNTGANASDDPSPVNFPGYTDWRIPTLDELKTLFVGGSPDSPCLDPVFDTLTAESDYWSSTTLDAAPGLVSIVDFGRCMMINKYAYKDTLRHARAVRGGRR